MLVLRTDRPCTDINLPILLRDSLLEGASNGVLSLFDFASRYSFPTQANPVNGTAAINMIESGDNGAFVVQAGQTLAYAGNGVRFAGVTSRNNYFGGTAAAASNLWGGGAGQQYFLQCLYLKLPAQADWNTSSSIAPLLQWAISSGNFQVGADVLTIAQASAGIISARRQTSLGTTSNLQISVPTSDYGQVAQLAYWRNAAGTGLRLRTASNSTIVTGSTGANNAVDFSACSSKFGAVGSFYGSGTIEAAHQSAQRWSLFRAFLENLTTSGRDPLTVLDADYTRTVSRSVFS